MRARPYYCPNCGDAALVFFDNKIFGCSRCGYTYYHNTAVGVSAVIRCASRMAWITRAADPGKGRLDLPGGFVEGDESLEMAVIREVREETGFVLASPRYLFSMPNRYQHHSIEYCSVDVFFAFDLAASPAFVPNDEAQALHWLTLDEVTEEAIAFESVRKALARLRQEI